MVREMERLLEGSPAKPLGVVITAAEADEGYGYGYYRRGYYRYLRRPAEVDSPETVRLR
jgi:hypothetical protein